MQTMLDVRTLLTEAEEQLTAFQVTPAMDTLCDSLWDLRRELPPAEWERLTREECRTHPVQALLHESPLARRAFVKPRGYPGDAELLDLVYGHGELPTRLPAIAGALYGYEVQMTAAVSVRARRDLLATLIDCVAGEVRAPRVLSVACGHLREGPRSRAVRERRISAFYALDQDERSLNLVAREQGAYGVQPVHGSVRSLLAGDTRFEPLDLVYAAGLYDYLEHKVAAQLTATLFSMLRPGGRLLVANFAPSLRDAGYMEAFLDWVLIYRDEPEVERFVEQIPVHEIASRRLFRDAPGNVVYLEVRRS